MQTLTRIPNNQPLEEALQLAKQFCQTNRLAEAQNIYLDILSKQPKQLEALLGLGQVVQQRNDLEAAQSLFKSAVQAHSGSVQAWFSLGNVYHALEDFQNAEIAYRKALDLQPNIHVIHNNLGDTLQKQGQLEEASTCYQTALKIRPNFLEADISLGYVLHLQGLLEPVDAKRYAQKNMELGLIAQLAGNTKGAEEYFRHAITLCPQTSMAYFYLGILLQEQDRLDEAIDCYQKNQNSRDALPPSFSKLLFDKQQRLTVRYPSAFRKHDRDSSKQEASRVLKVAFVNQYCDTILPPSQNSVGACTYGITRPLAECHDVISYSLGPNRQETGISSPFYNQGINYYFVAVNKFDLNIFNYFHKYRHYLKIFNGGSVPPDSTFRWTFPFYGRAIANDLRSRHCDIVHFQHTSQYIRQVRFKNPDAKLVLTIHHERYPQSDRQALLKRLKHLDLITCVSDYIREKTQKDFPEIADRCHTVHNGVNISEFLRQKNYALLNQQSIKRIMYAGAVSPEKGVHVLIEALKLVNQQYPNVQLDIFGPLGCRPLEEVSATNTQDLLASLSPLCYENYPEYLKKQLDASIIEKVHLRGMVPRAVLIDSYYKADIFVFPSLWDEGFGLPPVEAMAAGTPVISTRSGAVVETVRDQSTGYLVEKNNPSALASRLLDLLQNSDLREAMGKAARQHVLENFTWDQSANTLIALYDSLF